MLYSGGGGLEMALSEYEALIDGMVLRVRSALNQSGIRQYHRHHHPHHERHGHPHRVRRHTNRRGSNASMMSEGSDSSGASWDEESGSGSGSDAESIHSQTRSETPEELQRKDEARQVRRKARREDKEAHRQRQREQMKSKVARYVAEMEAAGIRLQSPDQLATVIQLLEMVESNDEMHKRVEESSLSSDVRKFVLQHLELLPVWRAIFVVRSLLFLILIWLAGGEVSCGCLVYDDLGSTGSAVAD